MAAHRLRALLLALALVGPGGTAIAASEPSSPPRERVLARVGEVPITDRDVALRRILLEARGAAPAASAQATVELLREALEREVARRLGLMPTPDDLAALDRHATATSREPETLARLREAAGTEGFARQVLMPRVTILQLRQRFDATHTDADASAYGRWYRQLATTISIDLGPAAAADLCPAYSAAWWLQGPCAKRVGS